MRRSVSVSGLCLLLIVLPGIGQQPILNQVDGTKRVGFQGTSGVPAGQQASVYVEPVMLTEVYDRIGPSLNVGAVVTNEGLARGLQKGADIWGLQLDIFVSKDLNSRQTLAR